MDLIALSRLGVRHLVALHMLLDTRSVTRAAERLCTSPSAVSKTLGQLRETLGDQLLYRQGNQLIPTAFAERLAPSLHRLLVDLNALLGEGEFNPASWRGRLRIALRESSLAWLGSPLLGRLMEEVPGLEPEVWSKEARGLDALAQGRLDFVILPHDQSQPRHPGLEWETLCEDRLICLLRPDHPALGQPWSLDAYLSWRHIAIRDEELATPFFEQQLAQLQVQRRIGATLPDFGSAAALCRHSDLVLTCSQGWAHACAPHLGLISRPVPFEYGAVTHSLVWFGPAGQDPAMSWIRQRLLQLANELQGPTMRGKPAVEHSRGA
ncbi:LysR family transcriptional regulator [Aeromonas diversa]|uniref:LysR family transcriptional regulator n=1 Tax=Aeromonas diversa TaxID=502790 RepID=UPI0039A075B4